MFHKRRKKEKDFRHTVHRQKPFFIIFFFFSSGKKTWATGNNWISQPMYSVVCGHNPEFHLIADIDVHNCSQESLSVQLRAKRQSTGAVG